MCGRSPKQEKEKGKLYGNQVRALPREDLYPAGDGRLPHRHVRSEPHLSDRQHRTLFLFSERHLPAGHGPRVDHDDRPGLGRYQRPHHGQFRRPHPHEMGQVPAVPHLRATGHHGRHHPRVLQQQLRGRHDLRRAHRHHPVGRSLLHPLGHDLHHLRHPALGPHLGHDGRRERPGQSPEPRPDRRRVRRCRCPHRPGLPGGRFHLRSLRPQPQ